MKRNRAMIMDWLWYLVAAILIAIGLWLGLRR